MLTTSARSRAAGESIDRAVRAALESFTAKRREAREAFYRLLVRARSAGLFCIPKARACCDEGGYQLVADGLLALAFWRDWWLRPLESWQPEGHNPRPRFASLARHLLAAFPVPTFMTNVWLEGQSASARRHQGWFIHLGSGKN